MTYQTLLYSTAEEVATITLNRPERLNTIVPPMPQEIESAVRARAPTRRQGDRPAGRRALLLCRL